MYALMRQESRFVPSAHSSADARGLTQVIPSTGAGIADQLGNSRYTTADLYCRASIYAMARTIF